MNKLTNLVTIIANDDDSVILKVKNNKRIDLIKTGYFNGDEEMFRVTKTKDSVGNLTYTIFKKDGSHFSWGSNELISTELQNKQAMIYDVVHFDFGIHLKGNNTYITNHIKTLKDDKKKSHVFKAMWFNEDNIQLHKDGMWFACFHNLSDVENYIKDNFNVKNIENSKSPQTDCDIRTFYTVC